MRPTRRLPSEALELLFEQRAEARTDAGSGTAVLGHGGSRHVVRLVNLSPSGAMIATSGSFGVGDPVTLQLLDHGAVRGQVKWVRGGRLGINFQTRLS